jgi:phosphotransferase system enzyme I (PtsI)
VSPGIAVGEAVVHETRPISTLRITIPTAKVEAEIERFRKAIATTVDQIQENRNRASQQMGEEYAAIFEAHQLIASDPSFTGPVEKVIREEEVNAGWAIDQVLEELIARFEALPDEYLADRKMDVLDVATQILHALHGLDLGQLEQLDRPVILVADDTHDHHRALTGHSRNRRCPGIVRGSQAVSPHRDRRIRRQNCL